MLACTGNVTNLSLIPGNLPAAWLDKCSAGRPYLFLMATKIKRIGILTAGGDSPGLNAAIRGVGKAALGYYGWEIVGFRDGFRGSVDGNINGATFAHVLKAAPPRIGQVALKLTF
jgi:hypothetical protein